MSDPRVLSTERLAEIRERAEAATPEPWRVVGRDFALLGFPQVELPTEDGHYFSVNFPADADFIASARADVPALLAHIAAMTDVLRDVGLEDLGTGPICRLCNYNLAVGEGHDPACALGALLSPASPDTVVAQ